MKSITKTPALFSCLVILAAAGLFTAARADQWDKKTIMTISETIQVPNKVLDPGTYVFKLVDSQSDRHIVRIFNQDESHLVTTILAIPNYRLQPSGKTEFAFWETPAGQPRALRAWFYPGDNFGQEFAYSATMSSQISANNNNTTVPVEPAPVASTTTPEPQPVSEAVPEPVPESEPAPAPQTTAAVTPEPAVRREESVVEPSANPSQATELPHTASRYPLIAMGGLLSLLAFSATTLRLKRSS
jgi:outer membrane biosynthesis protein TonB